MFKGKAGSLKFLKSLNLNVPEFVVIEHDEIISWGNRSAYQELLSEIEAGSQDKVIEAARKFSSTITIPELNLPKDKFYAVRSSASLEDSPENSFAGIFETILFVTEPTNEIKDVWLSLFSPKSLQYCTDRKLSWNDLKMDIVIQEMVHGEKSGVMFQANPTGIITEQVVVAGYGLGQGIVDEVTDTDRYIIENPETIKEEIQKKNNFLTYEQNKILKEAVPPEKQDIPVLNSQELHKLIEVSKIISSVTDYFMDIEFTFKGSELYILQARPITTIPAKKLIQIFDNSNIAENYPGFSTPLTFSGLQRGYAKNFKNLIRFVGLKDSDWAHLNNQLDQLVGYWGGQIYYNLNNWYSVYSLLPFGAEKAVASFNEMVGIRTSSAIDIPERSLAQKMMMLLRILPRFFSFYVMGNRYHQQYKMNFSVLYGTYKIKADEAEITFELIKLLEGLDNDYMNIIKIPLFNDFFSSVLNRSCRKLAVKIHPEKGEQLYNDLLSNREDLESSRAIYSLIDLAEMVKNNPELKAYLETSHKPDPRFEEFFENLKVHFNRYGDRSQWEMKIEVPTARENPETTIRLILEYASLGITRDDQRQKEKEKSDLAKEELKTKSDSPVTSFLFWKLFTKCTEALAFREDSRFDRVRFKGLSRLLLLKLGDKLVQKSYLEKTEDLFYLTYDEIMSLVHDSYGPTYWKELIELRKKHLKPLHDIRLPDRILTNDLTSVTKYSQIPENSQSDKLKGIPCSGGLVEAPCEIVLDLNQAPSLSGKILVAERTDPAWGYFFVGVKGIIIEKGSMLSHAAIISRELGIPCIINVKNSTHILKSGSKLRMNGDTGDIEIIS